MQEIFRKNKAVLKFLALFFGSYIVFTFLYDLYLEYGSSQHYYPDYITHLVSLQSEKIIEIFGYTSRVLPHPNEASMKLYVNDVYLARVVEGCNAVSVLVLFVSFIFAFHAKWKATLLYAFAGCVVIYAFNIVRIALLSIGLYEYPESKDLLHDILFPAAIYGSVFVLWLIWVNWVTKSKPKASNNA